MKKLKVVVSDFHIGSGVYFKDGTRNILEDFQYDDAFISFLNHYSSGENFDADVELVINGDFMNLLQINYKGVYTHLITERIVVEGLRQSVQGHRDLFEAMKRFAHSPNHKVTYVVGNHDQGMLFSKARKFFSEVLECDVTFYDDAYEVDGVRMEHGHMYEWNSRFDTKRYFVSRGLPEPVLNLPWGSRFVAEFLAKLKMERPYIDKVKPFKTMIFQTFLGDTVWAVMGAFRVIWYFLQTLLLNRSSSPFTWKGEIGLLGNLTMYPDFAREAQKKLASSPHIHTMIMGHLHIPNYRRFREGKEYFNTGTWNEITDLSMGMLGTHVKLTYALIEYPQVAPDVDPSSAHDQAALRPKVKLKEWKGHWRPEIDAAI